MNQKRRAFFLAALVGVIGALPVAYLWQLREADATLGLRDAGEVPQFTLSANGGTSGVTSLETYKRVSVILNIPPQAKDKEIAIEVLKQAIESTANRYKISNPNDPHPQSTLFMVFANELDSTLPESVRQVEFAADEIRPIPESAKSESVFLLISPESRYRAIIPASRANAGRALDQMISRLNADSYLYHYLALQSLIWRQAKSYIRGEEVKAEF